MADEIQVTEAPELHVVKEELDCIFVSSDEEDEKEEESHGLSQVTTAKSKPELRKKGGTDCVFCDKKWPSGASLYTLSRHITAHHKDIGGTFFRYSICPAELSRRRQADKVDAHVRKHDCGGHVVFDYDSAPFTRVEKNARKSESRPQGRTAPSAKRQRTHELEDDEASDEGIAPRSHSTGPVDKGRFILPAGSLCPSCGVDFSGGSARSFYDHARKDHGMEGSLFTCSICPEAKGRTHTTTAAHLERVACDGHIVISHDPDFTSPNNPSASAARKRRLTMAVMGADRKSASPKDSGLPLDVPRLPLGTKCPECSADYGGKSANALTIHFSRHRCAGKTIVLGCTACLDVNGRGHKGINSHFMKGPNCGGSMIVATEEKTGGEDSEEKENDE